MRFLISIVAALMILGLAAFGVVSAQKMLAAPSSATASDSPPATVQTAPRRHPVNPVSQLAQTGAESAATLRDDLNAAAKSTTGCPTRDGFYRGVFLARSG